jgi:hypothetical protein
MNLMKKMWITLFLGALCILVGCASLYHKDTESPDAAYLVVKLEKFPNIKHGKKPFIDKINGRYVAYGAFKNEYALIPGEHTFRIEHCKESGWPTASNVNVRINEAGKYNLVFEFVNDDNIKVEIEPCETKHRVLSNPSGSL